MFIPRDISIKTKIMKFPTAIQQINFFVKNSDSLLIESNNLFISVNFESIFCNSVGNTDYQNVVYVFPNAIIVIFFTEIVAIAFFSYTFQRYYPIPL